MFVYGTLRSGQRHSAVIDPGAVLQRERAVAPGIAVYGAGWSFPYAQWAPQGRGHAVGELVTLASTATGDAARRRLDALEEFDADHPSRSHYLRLRHRVSCDDPAGPSRPVLAWVYLRNPAAVGGPELTEAVRVAGGDWVAAATALLEPPEPPASVQA